MSTIDDTTIFSAADLVHQAFDPLRWIVPNLLPEGLTLLAGAPKSGKSWIALDLAVAVAGGYPVLDAIAAETGDVLYLAVDDLPRRLHTRLKHVLADRPIPGRLDLVSQDRRCPPFGEDARQRIEKWIATRPEARLIVVDSWSKASEQSVAASRAARSDSDSLAAFIELLAEHRIALLMVYHTRKTTPDAIIEAAQTALKWPGAIDNVLVVKRAHGAAHAILEVLGSDVEDQELFLAWSAATMRWSLRGPASEIRGNLGREAILALLERAGIPLGPQEVFDLLQVEDTPISYNPAVSYGAVRQRMFQMARAGMLQGVHGKYALPSYQASPPKYEYQDPRGRSRAELLERLRRKLSPTRRLARTIHKAGKVTSERKNALTNLTSEHPDE